MEYPQNIKYPAPTEAQEQETFVEWLELKGYKFTAIPNSTYTTSWKQKIKNKRVGLRAGLPDLLVIVPNENKKPNSILVFVEMKRKGAKVSAVSDEQGRWLSALNWCEGVTAEWCAGVDQAIKFIESISKRE